MSGKPKAREFKAGEQEQFLSETAKAEKDYFNQKYAPLLKQAAQEAETQDLGALSRGVAQADTMQALTGRGPTLGSVTSIDAAADRAIAAGQQQIQGSAQGLQVQRQRQLGALGIARGQQADTAAGLAQAAKIESTRALQDAQARQTMRQARTQALSQIGAATAAAGMKNLATYQGANYGASGEAYSEFAKGGQPSFFTRLTTPFTGVYQPKPKTNGSSNRGSSGF